MKRHLILLFSALAGIAAAENVMHNMVSRHTPVNTNLIGAVVGEGLTLTNGVLSSTGGGGSGGTDGQAVTNIVVAGGYTITNEVRFADADGNRLTIWRNNNGDKEIYARDMSLTYRSEYNSLSFKNTDIWLDSWELLYGGLQSLPDYIDERLASYARSDDLDNYLLKSERDLRWDSATNIVWKNVYSNGWVYLMPFARTEEVTQ